MFGWRCDRTWFDINIGFPLVGRVPGGNEKRMKIGTVERRGHLDGVTVICNFVGRTSGGREPEMQVKRGHHIAQYLRIPCDCCVGRPHYVRLVYLDIRKVRTCSDGTSAFHSFVGPRKVRQAKSIMRTLFVSHCQWVGVLFVRGRCFNWHGFRLAASRVLETLL